MVEGCANTLDNILLPGRAGDPDFHLASWKSSVQYLCRYTLEPFRAICFLRSRALDEATRCLFSRGRSLHYHSSISRNATERQVGLGLIARALTVLAGPSPVLQSRDAVFCLSGLCRNVDACSQHSD
jgi:hypothetical protein